MGLTANSSSLLAVLFVRQPNNKLKPTTKLQIQVKILCWSIDTSRPWLCRIVLPNEYTLIFYHMFGFFCTLCSGGWLTGAAGERGVAVSAIESILAGTNIGSSCTGATVGRAGGTGSLTEFGFEGPWDAGWMSGRENKKGQCEQKQRTHAALSLIKKDKWLSHPAPNKKAVPVKCLQSSIFTEKRLDMCMRNGKHLSIRSYLYICICSFNFTLSARWH